MEEATVGTAAASMDMRESPRGCHHPPSPSLLLLQGKKMSFMIFPLNLGHLHIPGQQPGSSCEVRKGQPELGLPRSSPETVAFLGDRCEVTNGMNTKLGVHVAWHALNSPKRILKRSCARAEDSEATPGNIHPRKGTIMKSCTLTEEAAAASKATM